MERTRQTTDTNSSVTNQLLADWSRGRASCAQSRRSTRLQAAAAYCGSGKTAWQTCQLPSKWDWRWPSLCQLDLERTSWLCLRALNRLRTGVGRAKTVMRRWGYLDDAQSVDCDCGEPQAMAHIVSCRLLDEACTADDLATVIERAKACFRKWGKLCEGQERRRKFPIKPRHTFWRGVDHGGRVSSYECSLTSIRRDGDDISERVFPARVHVDEWTFIWSTHPFTVSKVPCWDRRRVGLLNFALPVEAR